MPILITKVIKKSSHLPNTLQIAHKLNTNDTKILVEFREKPMTSLSFLGIIEAQTDKHRL